MSTSPRGSERPVDDVTQPSLLTRHESAPGKKVTPGASIALGGAAAMFAVNFTHPIELVKTRLQVQGSAFSFSAMVRSEGVLALWKGIVPALGREMFYSSVKVGGYAPIRDAIGAGSPNAPLYLKFLAGSLSGGIGSVIGNPFDVLKTLMQTNAAKAPPITTLAAQMYREQGIGGFYRGVEANVMRACVLNGTKMMCYDQFKGVVVNATGWSRKDVKCQFMSSARDSITNSVAYTTIQGAGISQVGAGFCMTCTVSPFDMVRAKHEPVQRPRHVQPRVHRLFISQVRTKLMNQPTDQKLYSGFVDCFLKVVRADGPLALYRGFLPIWMRFAPQATLQLVSYEMLLKNFGYKTI
jgi:hypothetical protein